MIEQEAIERIAKALNASALEAQDCRISPTDAARIALHEINAFPRPVKEGEAVTAIEALKTLRRHLSYLQPNPDYQAIDMAIETIELLQKRCEGLEFIRSSH